MLEDGAPGFLWLLFFCVAVGVGGAGASAYFGGVGVSMVWMRVRSVVVLGGFMLSAG